MKTINREKVNKSKKIVFLTTLLCIIFLYLNKRFSFYVPCIFHKITHLYCPGCGITRMIISIFKLDLYQAFRFNPLAFILMPFMIIYGLYYYICWLHDKKFKTPNKYWYLLLVITLLFMVLRNTQEFSYLAPTVIKK